MHTKQRSLNRRSNSDNTVNSSITDFFFSYWPQDWLCGNTVPRVKVCFWKPAWWNKQEPPALGEVDVLLAYSHVPSTIQHQVLWIQCIASVGFQLSPVHVLARITWSLSQQCPVLACQPRTETSGISEGNQPWSNKQISTLLRCQMAGEDVSMETRVD